LFRPWDRPFKLSRVRGPTRPRRPHVSSISRTGLFGTVHIPPVLGDQPLEPVAPGATALPARDPKLHGKAIGLIRPRGPQEFLRPPTHDRKAPAGRRARRPLRPAAGTVQHRAIQAYDLPRHRPMHRTTMAGAVPV
jgi:hypothetical protein